MVSCLTSSRKEASWACELLLINRVLALQESKAGNQCFLYYETINWEHAGARGLCET